MLQSRAWKHQAKQPLGKKVPVNVTDNQGVDQWMAVDARSLRSVNRKPQILPDQTPISIAPAHKMGLETTIVVCIVKRRHMLAGARRPLM
jgi:hypothetical protein